MKILKRAIDEAIPHSDLKYPNQAKNPSLMLEGSKGWMKMNKEEERCVKDVDGVEEQNEDVVN